MQKADDFFSETERLGFRFLECHLVGQNPADHVDQDTHKRAQPGLVRRLSDNIKTDGLAFCIHDILNLESGFPGIGGHNRITEQRKIGFCRGQNGASFLLRAINHVLGAFGHCGMRIILIFFLAGVMTEGFHLHPHIVC